MHWVNRGSLLRGRGTTIVYSLFQYIIGDGKILSWTGPCVELNQPEHLLLELSICDRWMSVTLRCPTVINCFSHLLNTGSNFYKTSLKVILGWLPFKGTQTKLFKQFNFMQNSGCHSDRNGNTKILLSKSTESDPFEINLVQVVPLWPSAEIVQMILISQKTWPPGADPFCPITYTLSVYHKNLYSYHNQIFD